MKKIPYKIKINNINKMTQFIIYSLDSLTHSNLQIISIETNEKTAKTILNTHAFDLLSKLSSNSNNLVQNSYRLEINNNIIQIIEITPSISKGWISNSINENRRPIYELGVIEYKTNAPIANSNISININETYMNTSTTIVQDVQAQIPKPPKLPKAPQISKEVSKEVSKEKKGPSWDDVLLEIKKRRCTIH
jgi:hypothetical protein